MKRHSWARYFNPPFQSALEEEIRKATYSLYNFCGDGVLGMKDRVPRELLRAAKGIVFLTLVKAGMFVTARVGTGMVIARLDREAPGGREGGRERGREGGRERSPGRWSAPSALACTGIGYGFSFGADVVRMGNGEWVGVGGVGGGRRAASRRRRGLPVLEVTLIFSM